MHVLGLDAGGTKTVCLLADEEGHVVAEARGGGANLQASGELEVEKVLHGVMADAIGDRRIVPAAICLGIAGVDRPGDSAVVRAIMGRIGHRARVLVVNDALVALEAGAPGQPGVVVISGTGSIAYGRNAAGEAARSGGWGYVLGDEGSGYWIGRAALRAVLRESDRRGPRTALSDLLLRHFGVRASSGADPRGLQHEPEAGGHRRARPVRPDGFLRGRSRSSIGILRAAANELEAAALSVARRLELIGQPFAFILAGGIFRAVPWVEHELERRLPDRRSPQPRAAARSRAGHGGGRARAAGSAWRRRDSCL